MGLAEILYLVVRGGFFPAAARLNATESINPFGIAALAGLAGMFSKEATDKLQELFKNLFRTEKPVQRADSLKDQEKPPGPPAPTPSGPESAKPPES